MIKERLARRNKDYPYGRGYEYWTDTFDLCKDVPKLIQEIERLRNLSKSLQEIVDKLRSPFDSEDYECEL